MFQELMPLLGQRTLLLTLARINGEEICVNVIPKPLKPADKEENSAISIPLSVTGTPEELDRELPKQLVDFVAAHLELSSTLANAKSEMAAAAKSARDNAARKSTPAKAGPPSTGRGSGSECETATVPVSGKSTSTPASLPVPSTGSLFDPGSRES
jgi:PRTRC genetic system protein E